MKNLNQKFEDNYLLGCMKYKGRNEIYLMPIAWWILNYKKYDPGYNPAEWQSVFRDNVLNVIDSEVERFFKSIQFDKLNLDEFKNERDNIPEDYQRIYFYIDFDKKVFINGFYDVSVEEYLPDTNWKGKLGNPIDFLPEELSTIFRW